MIAAAIVALGVGYRVLHFSEKAIAQRVASIPGASVKAVWEAPDLFPNWFYAQIDVQGGPTLYIFRLTRRSFDGPGGFCFFQIGAYAVRYASQHGISNSLCFEASGEISGLGRVFPVEIRLVRDFVEHAGDIEHTLALWPRCPDYKELTGTKSWYRVCTTPDASIQMWPQVPSR